MAALTWREVSAPQLSTRDLALAGQTMTQGFDRLGQVLLNREQSLMKKATDQAIAARLVQQDPNAMGQLDLTGLDRRVDLRALAEADNSHRAQLVERQRANEELLNSQANSQFGTVIAGLADAALAGDAEAEATLKAGRENDPMFARALAQHYEKITGFRDDGVDNRLEDNKFGETVRSNKASEAGSAADRALRARAINNDEAARAGLEKGNNLGIQLAERLRLQGGEDAIAALYETPEYKNATREERMGIMETFAGSHAAYSREDAGTRSGLREVDNIVGGRLTALEAEANRAEQAAKNPMVEALRRADALGDKLDMRSLTNDLAERGGWQFTAGMAKDRITKIQSDIMEETGTKPTLADIQAALDMNGFAEGVGKQIPVWNELVFNTETSALAERVKEAMKARSQGYNANAEVDRKSARAPSEAEAANLASDRERLGRMVRAHNLGQLTVSQIMEMERLKQRLERAADPPRK